jgi:predicted NACHT family NTPase
MISHDELEIIFERIVNHQETESDRQILRTLLFRGNGDNEIQIGKNIVNISEGRDIQIGDRIYQGTDTETIRAILLEVLSQNTQHIEIDWHDISQTMLSEQQRLTTNPLTSGEGISYRTEQVYVPLGLVERKKQTRRKEDVSPEQGSELYRETEITQTFEHQQFLEQVIKQRQSPKSQGKRIAIIGEPGAGKTTLLQQIAGWVSGEMPNAVVIWVSLADLQGRELEAYLFEVWLQAVARKVGQAEASTQIKDDFVAQFNRGLVWLLLDGVDEMQATVGNPLAECDRQLRTGTLLQQAQIVLSCRLNLWDGGSNALDTFDNYRTLEFSYPQQVEQFISNWFGSLPSAETQTGQRLCEALGKPGKERIRDLAKNPLRLTLLCFNWYLGEGKLPETKAGLYEQFVADFYEWKKGQFATTGEQRKRLNAALGELAREAIDKEATRFRLRQDFVCEYLGELDDADSLFGLALRLGWLNKVGVDGDNPRKGVYGFFHPTFQEYFAAKDFCDRADWEGLVKHLWKEDWQEIFFLAIGIAIKADELLLSIKNEIDCLLAADKKLQQFLTWVHKKSSYTDTYSPIQFKPAAIRAFYFALDRNLDPYLTVTLDRNFNYYNDFDHSYIRRWGCHSIREFLCNWDMCADFHLSLLLDTNLSIDSQLTFILDYATHYQYSSSLPGCTDLTSYSTIDNIYRKISDSKFRYALQKLKNQLPENEAYSGKRKHGWQDCQQWWKENREDWVTQLKSAIAKYRDINHNWYFTEEQEYLINMYYSANKLLIIDYLNGSRKISNSVKCEIEKTVLLPIDEISKQKLKKANLK